MGPFAENEDDRVRANFRPHYTCEHCGSLINDGQKLAMLRKGQWRAQMAFTGYASFHLNELYSPFRTFADIVIILREEAISYNLKSK